MPLPNVRVGNAEALYNIGVVSRMTGISMATLRAWERRYDFPSSMRTPGGHRLYSDKNIMQLTWVKERIDEGMQTAQAINALHYQEQSGRFVYPEGETSVNRDLFDRIQIDELRTYLQTQQYRLYSALSERHTGMADEILSESLAISTPENVVLEVIAPVLNRIGEGWERGEISISTEHQGTNYLRQRLLMWMVSSPPAQETRPIILACAPGEWHEGSLLILGALLRRKRWPVIYLGQSVPFEDLESFVRSIHPGLVVLVAMTEKTAAAAIEWPHFMPEVHESGVPKIGFGGRVFVEQSVWRAQMPGVYLGSTFEEGLLTIEQLISE